LFSNNKIGKELGFLEISNPNIKILNFYYTQSVDEYCVEEKSHFQLAKIPKMNLEKRLRNKYIKNVSS